MHHNFSAGCHHCIRHKFWFEFSPSEKVGEGMKRCHLVLHCLQTITRNHNAPPHIYPLCSRSSHSCNIYNPPNANTVLRWIQLWVVFDDTAWSAYVLNQTHYKVNTRVWCRLCRLQLSSPPACQSQESSAERNLWNNFSGFIGKSASFPCSCETLSQDFVEIGADKKLVKSLSTKMWRSGLDYPPVPWNLRLGTMKPIEKFGKVSCQHGQ